MQLGRPHTAVMEEVRQNLAQIPGVVSEVGQPISHRIDHLLSGTRAQIAIKLFGPDLVTLRNKAEEIRKAMETVPGLVDLHGRAADRRAAGSDQPRSTCGRSAGFAGRQTLAETVDVAFNGEAVSQVLEDQRTYDVVVRFDDASRQSVETIASTLVDTPAGAKVPISQVAEVRVDQGPNTINRENVQRRIIVQANVANRDLGSVIDEIRAEDRARCASARGLLRPVWRPVRSAGGGGTTDHDHVCCRHCGHFPSALSRVGIRPPGVAGHGQPAVGADRRSDHGVCFGRNVVHRFVDWVHHAVRNRDPQRNHADHALPAPDQKKAFRSGSPSFRDPWSGSAQF